MHLHNLKLKIVISEYCSNSYSYTFFLYILTQYQICLFRNKKKT